MSSKWRRYEVLLPVQFNDGREIPPEWLADAVFEIVEHRWKVKLEQLELWMVSYRIEVE